MPSVRQRRPGGISSPAAMASSMACQRCVTSASSLLASVMHSPCVTVPAKPVESQLSFQQERSVYAKTRIGRWLATAMTAFLFVPASVAQEAIANAPIIDFQTRFLPTVAKNGMVVAPERLAADIGASILKRGGNAVDAAVATGFALAVTYPRAGNIGGGGFMLIHLAEENRQTLIDYREKAPAAATADPYLD